MNVFFTEEKLLKQINELEPYRYRESTEIAEFRSWYDEKGEIGTYPDTIGYHSGKMRVGDCWTGRDAYLWLSAEVEIPKCWSGRRVLGRFRFGKTGGGNNSGFESLLFVDNKPYQGVDSNHDEVFFDPSAVGRKLRLDFRLWSGLNGYDRPQPLEHRISKAELCWLDEPTDDLYFTAKAVLETCLQLEETCPERHDLLSALNKAFHTLDWSRPGSEEFYKSVEEARGHLRSMLLTLPKASSVVVQCIGHTHIDVAWLWRLKHTREKATRSFSTVLRLMEMYPEYIFLQTQPQLYEYMKEDYPEIYEQIKERISEGRWEAGGAMWLEADCNLPSGESLVRQILYGTKFLREEFGVECRYLWLPDVFGYSWALPQILKKSGIDVFMTTKISWNQYNRMPHDTFIWRGIDGTGILTHFITTPDPGGNEGAFYYTYNGGISPFSIRGIWDGYRDKSLNRKLLLAYGFGDGGGGANREMLEMRRRLSELPGLPQVTTGRADRYFEELKKTVESADQYVHTWDGELYLELHRGTYTSQAYNKRMNRKLELLYREAEWLQVMSYVTGKETASFQTSDELTKGWKIILRNQFHDIIPGSSIREVYEDSREEYLQAQHIGEKVCRQELAKLVEQDDRVVTVINSAPWHRHEPVLVKKPAVQGAWLASDGSVCTSQITEDGMLVYVPDVPGMGTTKLSFVSAVDEKKETIHRQEHFIPSQSGIETPFYLVEWNEFGQFTRIFDKEAGREVLADGEAGNVFQVFEDKPKSRHEAWDVDIFYQEKQRTITDCRSLELVEIGPLQAVYRIVWKYMDSVISQDIVFYANSRRIDFRTRVDWHEQRQLLKVAFPVKIRATEATYDIQFGNVKRPTHWNTSWDLARFETVGHQWADLSERDYGVSLLNDCKYGYDIKENRMRLSLIKSALVPDETADQGEHIFTYSLYPHLGDWYSGGTVREAWSLNQPLTLCAGNPLHNIMSLFEFSLANVMVDSVKPAESGEGIILRIHEYAGARGELAIKCGFPFKDWAETNLLEVPLGEPNNGDMKTVIAPYEIKTFLIRLV